MFASHRARRRIRGATLVEYLVLVGLVAVVALLGVRRFGSSVGAKADAQADCVATLSCGPGAAPGEASAPILLAATPPTGSSEGGGEGGGGDDGGGGFLEGVGNFFSSTWEGTKSVATGFFVDGAWGTVTGAWHIVRHPVATAEGLWTAVTNPIETGTAIKDAVVTAWNEDPARLIGGGIFEIVTAPLAAAKVTKATRVVEAVDDVADAARVVDNVDDVTDAARAADGVDDAVRVSSETTGAVTNLGTRTVADNAALFARLAPGDGMTGVFDHSTGTVILRPSVEVSFGMPLPEGAVARYGGHADVRADLGAALGEDLSSAAPGRISGFSITKNPDGTIGFGWNSGQINPDSHGDRGVPTELRGEIEAAVLRSLGQ